MGSDLADSSSKPMNLSVCGSVDALPLYRIGPRSDGLGNLCLLPNVFVVTVVNHDGVHPAWTTLEALDRGFEELQCRLRGDIALAAEKSQKRAMDSWDRRIWCPNSKEIGVSRRRVDTVQVGCSTHVGRKRALGKPD